MVQSVLILGGGGAGFIAAIALRTSFPALNVTVVRSREIGIIGVGESTVPWVVRFLHQHLKLDPKSFYKSVDPIWKLGIRFLWGSRPYFDFAFGLQLAATYPGLSQPAACYIGDDFHDAGPVTALMTRCKAFHRRPDGTPDLNSSYAYHLENVRFVAWLEEYARTLGTHIIEGLAGDVQLGPQGISAITLTDGRSLAADLFIDCSGFRSLLLGQALQEPYLSFASSLYCNSAVVGGWERAPGEPIQPYTTAETMEAGWCWQIDHSQLVNRGYVFASDFLTDDQAETEFRRKNPRVTDTRFIRFKSGRYHRAWVKNVIGLGNASGFVEPLESTAIAAFCLATAQLVLVLRSTACCPTPSWIDIYNESFARRWDGIRQFLAIHYRFNTRLDNEFWRTCPRQADLAGAQRVIAFYQENGPLSDFHDFLLDRENMFGAEGYLALLVGMRVPCKHSFVTPSELHHWQQLKQHHAHLAEQAFTTQEAMALLTSDRWHWKLGQT